MKMAVQISKGKSKAYVKLLVYSDQGIGKTTFAVSGKGHPEIDEILLVNIDKGELSIEDKNIDMATIGLKEDGSSSKSIVKDLEDVIFAIVAKKPGFEKYKTVVIDTITELQARDLEDLSEGKDQFSQLIYGKSTKKVKRLCALIRDAPLNIILTAQVKRIYEGPPDAKKLVEIRPDVTASACDAIMAAVNFVWYLYVPAESKKRTMVTKNMGIVRGKTRSAEFQNIIGEKLEDPNLADLYTKLLKVTE
jgi:hypothetical protein